MAERCQLVSNKAFDLLDDQTEKMARLQGLQVSRYRATAEANGGRIGELSGIFSCGSWRSKRTFLTVRHPLDIGVAEIGDVYMILSAGETSGCCLIAE